jgi:glycosyltransferase involved in cell wall biosynthesis
MFVHARAKAFVDLGHDITIYVPAKKTSSYYFEGVNVRQLPAYEIADLLADELIYIHLLNIYPNYSTSGWCIYKKIMKERLTAILYMHGSEVQKTTTRSFDKITTIKDILRALYKNYVFIPRMKRFCSFLNDFGGFITPSNWMLSEAQSQLEIKINNYEIIPNGIDCDLFKYSPNFENINRLICIRPLSSPKYAVDEAIQFLSLLPDKFTLDIYGKGVLKDELVKLSQKLGLSERVRFFDQFIARENLPQLLSNYGVFMANTRMDAQGVMMCEAMASGKLTITSNNTAIPEFVINARNGIVISEIHSAVDQFIDITNDLAIFSNITSNARADIESISINSVAERELDYMKQQRYFKDLK